MIILKNYYGWNNDARTIQFGSTKPDQTVETTADIKPLFANWKNPKICIILGLAVYVWTNRLCYQPKHLFEGNDQNKRYYTLLSQAADDVPRNISLCCDRTDIGNHSNRKFTESTAESTVSIISNTLYR